MRQLPRFPEFFHRFFAGSSSFLSHQSLPECSLIWVIFRFRNFRRFLLFSTPVSFLLHLSVPHVPAAFHQSSWLRHCQSFFMDSCDSFFSASLRLRQQIVPPALSGFPLPLPPPDAPAFFSCKSISVSRSLPVFLLQSFLFQKAIQRQLSVDLTMLEKIPRQCSHDAQKDQAQNHTECLLDIRHPRSPLWYFMTCPPRLDYQKMPYSVLQKW